MKEREKGKEEVNIFDKSREEGRWVKRIEEWGMIVFRKSLCTAVIGGGDQCVQEMTTCPVMKGGSFLYELVKSLE